MRGRKGCPPPNKHVVTKTIMTETCVYNTVLQACVTISVCDHEPIYTCTQCQVISTYAWTSRTAFGEHPYEKAQKNTEFFSTGAARESLALKAKADLYGQTQTQIHTQTRKRNIRVDCQSKSDRSSKTR